LESENNYLVYPNFARFSRDYFQIFLFKIKSDYTFCSKFSEKTFGEIRDLFIEKYPERCVELNNSIANTRHVFSFMKQIPCDLFGKKE